MITLEQVDQLRKRTNCSYEEAKALLEKNNGNVLEAIVDFEKSKNKKSYGFNEEHNWKNEECHWKKEGRDFWKKITEIVQKGFDNRVVIEDKNGVLLNLSVNLMLLILIIPPFTIPVLLILLLLMLLGYKISIKKKKGTELDISSMMKDAADKFTGKASAAEPQPPEQQNLSTEVKKDDYNEMTIE